MKPAHRPLVVVFVVLIAVTAVVVASRLMAAKEIVPWHDDFAAAEAESRASGKPLFVYFTADWCPPCHTMKSTTWADADVERALRSYVPARVDVMVNTPVALKYGAEYLPKYVLLDGAGNVVRALDGLVSPDEFLAWLERGVTPRQRGG